MWGRIRSVLLAGLGSLGLGAVLCRLPGLPAAYLWVMAGAGLFSGVCGVLARDRGRDGRTLMLLAAAGLALGLGLRIAGVWGGVYALAAAVAVFLASLAGDGLALGFAGLAALTLGLLVSGGGWRLLLSLCAAAALGLTLDGLRERNLRRGLLQPEKTPPRSLTMSSLRLSLLFLGGAVLAAAVSLLVLTLLKNGALALLRRLGGQGAALYEDAALLAERFRAWFMSHFGNYQPESYHTSGGGGDDWEPSVPAAITYTFLILAISLGIGAIAAGLAAVWHFSGKRPKKRQSQEPDYVDEIERLERPGAGALLRRLRRSDGRLRDYQGAMKIRFAFQTMLRRLVREGHRAAVSTPNELRVPGDPDRDALIDAYNRVRYAGGEPTETELAAAERVFRAMK